MTIKTILAALLLSGVAFAQGQFSGGGGSNAKRIQGVAVSSGVPSTGNCLVASSSTLWAPGNCTGTGASFQVNGTPTTSQTTINFQDSASLNGITLTFTNPSVGNVKMNLAGTATKSFGPATTVYTDQSNAYSTGSQDFSSSTNFKARVAASATAASNGEIVYDTTNKNWHMFGNAVDNLNVVIPVSITPANNDCAKFTVAAGVITLNTAGATCGAGGGGGPATSVNGTPIITQSLLNFVNSNAFNGLTFTFTNPSAGDVKAGFSGTLGNAGLTNSAVTVTAGTGLTGGGSVALGAAVTLNLGSLALANTPLTTAGDLLFANATPVLARLPIGSNGLCLTVSAGLPAWGSCSSGTISGTGANTQVAVFSGASSLTSFSTFTFDGSGNVTATSFNSSSANGGLDGTEGTGATLTAAAGHDLLWPDSTAHRWKMNNNNGGAVQVVGSGADINASDQVTITHIAGATSNTIMKANGTGNMVNSGITDNATTVTTTENVDFSGASSTAGFKPPAAAGAVPTTAGVLSFDTTLKSLVFGDGALTNKIAAYTGSAPTTGDCVKWSVTAGVVTLADQGAACGVGGSASTIASGTSALGTGAITTASCATVVTTSATGTASTDAIIWTPNGSIKAITGYVPATTGGLSIVAYPTTNNVNFDVCNWTSSSITPGALTLNWRVVR